MVWRSWGETRPCPRVPLGSHHPSGFARRLCWSIPTAKRGRQSLTNTALVSCLGTTESCSFQSGIKTLIKAPICIKSEIMLISPQFPLPSPYGSPKLCVYLSTMWQPLEMANRNACRLRNTSPAKHTPALDDRLLRRVGCSGLRTQLCS